jgi:hypothetical protein
MREGLPGLAQDRERGEYDENALDDRREELRLLVAIGVVGVRRDGSKAQGEERDRASGDIHHRLGGVGIKRGAAGGESGDGLQSEHEQADANASGCE